MVNITIGNNWGIIYAEALRKAGIDFLFEIDGDTKLTFADEDYKRAEAIMTETRNNHKALLYAEKHGIIEYHVDGNKMIYYSSFPLEHTTIAAEVNLDTMTENRRYLPEYYVAYSDLIDGKYQSNYCV